VSASDVLRFVLPAAAACVQAPVASWRSRKKSQSYSEFSQWISAASAAFPSSGPIVNGW
jgi:hypothetical protein